MRPVETHPFRRAWETRDAEEWASAMAPDVVLRSPVTRVPIQGRDAARNLYAILFERFGEVDLGDELADGQGAVAFFWTGALGRHRIEGTDLIRTDASGQITEITVMIRPLLDLATFAALVGPEVAKQRGPLWGAALRLLSLPLRAILLPVDLLAGRLVRGL